MLTPFYCWTLSKEKVIKNKAILSLVAIILLIAGGGYYFLPHLAFYNIKEAAENNDSETLSDYVDYPSLRKSLKVNINSKVTPDGEKGKDGDPLKKLSAVFADAFINTMIDSLVTPENLALFMKGIKPESSRIYRKSSETKTKFPAQKSKIKTSMSYKGFNHFVIKIKRKGFSENPIELIFKRDGLLSWKLSALHIP